MSAAGALFRNLVEGLMDVLRARAEMKSEFRVSVTTLRSNENNPLKFNPDVDSVLKLLTWPAKPRFHKRQGSRGRSFQGYQVPSNRHDGGNSGLSDGNFA